MELQTERLKLIPCTDQSLSIFSSEEFEIGPHMKMHLEELKKDSTLLGWGVWLVINKETNTIIGDIGFKGKPNSQKTVEVGYGIIPFAQSKGYATEAVKEIIQWAFLSNDVNEVVAECEEDNFPSIKVLEKLNMNREEKEGTMLKWRLKK